MLTLATATYKRYDRLIGMLDSAHSGQRRPDRYFIVDNGGTLEYSQIPTVRDTTTIRRMDRNIGVAASVNLIYRENDDITVWTNDDVLLEGHTLALIEKAALEDPARLFVVPRPNAAGGIFTVFCARKALFEKIGWFDERFFPAYFEDNDVAYRMQLAGVPYHFIDGSYHHFTSSTIEAYSKDERAAFDSQFRGNEELYRRKWGGPPGHETFTEPRA